jgi:hypothetical protein
LAKIELSTDSDQPLASRPPGIRRDGVLEIAEQDVDCRPNSGTLPIIRSLEKSMMWIIRDA